MIEDVRSNKLKRNHTGCCTPSQVVLKVPHARVTYHETALPSQVVLEVT